MLDCLTDKELANFVLIADVFFKLFVGETRCPGVAES